MQTKTDPGPPVFLTSSYSPPTSNLSNQIRPTLSFLVFTLLYNFYIQPRANTITSVGASLLPNIRFWLYTSYISTSAFYIFTSASIIFLLYVCPAPRTSPPPPPSLILILLPAHRLDFRGSSPHHPSRPARAHPFDHRR